MLASRTSSPRRTEPDSRRPARLRCSCPDRGRGVRSCIRRFPAPSPPRAPGPLRTRRPDPSRERPVARRSVRRPRDADSRSDEVPREVAPALVETNPSVSGESPVMFIRPVKDIPDCWRGPVARYARFSDPNGSASNGIRSWASAVATARPPTFVSRTSSMAVSDAARSPTSTVSSGPSVVHATE